MKFIIEHKVIVVVAIVFVLAFFITTNVMVDSSAEPYILEVTERTSVPTAAAQYFVTVGDDVIFTDEAAPMTKEEAQAHCDSVAFLPEHMWKRVVCTYGEVEIYNDIFIAG